MKLSVSAVTRAASADAMLWRNTRMMARANRVPFMLVGREDTHDCLWCSRCSSSEYVAFPAHWNAALCITAKLDSRWPLRVTSSREQMQQQACAKGSPYSITSSASASSFSGTCKPSDLAAFRLTTNSNLVGACTGRSAGLVPLRMRSIYPAACRDCSA